MDLDQWLYAYGAVTRSCSGREKSLWTASVGFLLAQSLLAFAYAFVEPNLLGGASTDYRTGFIVLGGLVAVVWGLVQTRLRAELLHFERILRQIEGQFAGGEFHRSLFQLAQGERICVSAAQYTCNEWLPDVARLPLLGRISAIRLMTCVPLLFVLGWLAVLLDTLIL